MVMGERNVPRRVGAPVLQVLLGCGNVLQSVFTTVESVRDRAKGRSYAASWDVRGLKRCVNVMCGRKGDPIHRANEFAIGPTVDAL